MSRLQHSFKAGSLSLDFALTYGWLGPNQGKELLPSPEHVASWLSQSPLRLANITVDESQLEQVYSLRHAIHALALAHAGQVEVEPDHIATVNHFASHARLSSQLRHSGQAWAVSSEATLDQALGEIANEAVELLASTEPGNIRECAAPNCWVIFVDRSRAGNRRWCSVTPCGQREISRAFRERQRAAVGADE